MAPASTLEDTDLGNKLNTTTNGAVAAEVSVASESALASESAAAAEGAVASEGTLTAILAAMDHDEDRESTTESPQHQPASKRARVSETGGDDDQDLSTGSDIEIDLQPLHDEANPEEQQQLYTVLQRLLRTNDLPSSLKRRKDTEESCPTTTAPLKNQNPEKLRELFEYHGLRTSLVFSPRPAVSIYKDSCVMKIGSNGEKQENHDRSEESVATGKEFIITMLGLHPLQTSLEQFYAAAVRPAYCLACFCRTVRNECPIAVAQSEELRQVLSENEAIFEKLGFRHNEKMDKEHDAKMDKEHEADGDEEMKDSGKRGREEADSGDDNNSHKEAKRRHNRSLSFLQRASILSSTANGRVASITQCVVSADPTLRVEQLQHEFERISYRNSTVTNAHLQLFLEEYKDFVIQEMYFKRAPTAKEFERITFYLYDPQNDPEAPKPDKFTLMPAISTLLQQGPEKVAHDMVHVVWKNLLRRGYCMTRDLKDQLTGPLQDYFLSGLTSDVTIPLPLYAHFNPSYQLSFYLEGKAGTGKSSLARNLVPALNAAIEEFADPEILVRYVKQSLNKPFDVLQLELELRPNNNDLSVMSIIQGRRLTTGQTKPGLVVVALEEMPPNEPQANPNQSRTCQLISQRFGGRMGKFNENEVAAPRNSTRRGISADARIIPIFTSNYPLSEKSAQALQRLELFSNLKCIPVSAVSGEDRNEFAYAYLRQCVQDQLSGSTSGSDTASNSGTSVGSSCNTKVIGRLDLDIPLGSGDLRPLVRHLRMLSFYVCVALANGGESSDSEHEAFPLVPVARKVVSKEGMHLKIVQRGVHCKVTVGAQSIDLKVGTMQNLFPVSYKVFDRRTESAIDGLREVMGGASMDFSELSIILDFWLSKTLAPTVLVSTDSSKIRSIIAGLGAIEDVQRIRNINAAKYKMTKSLYDDSNTRNLRDDIIKLGRGAFVAVELICETVDSQLCVRELIEDTPSMTAFSSDRSALYKSGLLFGIYVKGEITPELRSRASLIL